MRNLYAFILCFSFLIAGLGQAVKASDANCSSNDSTAFKSTTYRNISKSDFQVFPNPVIDKKMTISFNITRDSQVTIRLIDLLGNEVSVLMDERKNTGEYRTSFSLDENTRSGLYFVRVNIGNELFTKRIAIQ